MINLLNESKNADSSGDHIPGNDKGDDDEDHDDKDSDGFDGENQNESDFLEELDRVVNLSDVDQNFKGDNINYIGKLDSLGKEHKSKLKQLDYEDDTNIGGDKKVNQFIEAQQKKKKLDEQMNPQKHLLPKDMFENGDRMKKFNDK